MALWYRVLRTKITPFSLVAVSVCGFHHGRLIFLLKAAALHTHCLRIHRSYDDSVFHVYCYALLKYSALVIKQKQ